jgi:hypothetical protein
MDAATYQQLQRITRRHFLGGAGLGLGAMALSTLLERGAPAVSVPSHPAGPMHQPRARSIIYLHMAGAPSQLDLFENKPALSKYDGEACPQEYLEGKRFAFIKGVPTMLAPLFDYGQQGDSGQWVSELLPHFSSIIDDVCVIRSMTTDQFNHVPAQLLMHTGHPRFGGASFGSWVTYGIGSENANLPGFVVLASGGKNPDGGKSLWGSGFLPSVFQGVQCRTQGEPILYLTDPRGIDRELRKWTIDAVGDLNRMQHDLFGDPETLTRISQYELSFRMQMAVPEAVDIANEPQHILDLYGATPGYQSAADTADDPRTVYSGDDPTFANNCLLARRLVERGVRFVQLYDWGWDHHGSSPGESVDETLPIKCRQIDRAVAALVTDLKQRGMLDETLVVWGGEFGRTVYSQGQLTQENYGRDHHPRNFCMWLAGGGIKGGVVYGETDDFSYNIVQDPVHINDFNATILHCLGIDHERFTVKFQGLDQRLTGVEDPKIVPALLA